MYAAPAVRFPLSDAASSIGFEPPVREGETIVMSNRLHTFSFSPGRRKMTADGVDIWLNSKIDGDSGAAWRISDIDCQLLRHAVLTPADPTNMPMRVTVDAGHGGVDSGAVSDDGEIEEKSLTLSMALELGEMLRARGFAVNYTRTNDVSLSRPDRVRSANDFKSDLFVSLHCNKAPNIEANGVECYVLPACGFPGTAEGSRVHAWQPGNRSDVENMMAAYEIQKALVTNGTFRVDRGVRRQAFHVLRAAQCPAVLVEVGFMSHARELRKLNTPEWRTVQMRAVADGVSAYARRVCAWGRINAERMARLEAEEKARIASEERAAKEAEARARQEKLEEQKRREALAELERLEREERKLAKDAESANQRAQKLELELLKKTLTSKRIAEQLAAAEKAASDADSDALTPASAFMLDFYGIRGGGGK